MRSLARSLAVAAMLVLWPGVAAAAEVSVAGGELRIADPAGEDNVIDVVPSGPSYEVYDDRAPLTAGEGCVMVELKRVACFAVVDRISADGGAGDDLLGFVGLTVPVQATGGTGDDLLEGGDEAAVLSGGEGVDSLVGGADVDRLDGDAGDDLLLGGGEADTMSGADGDDIVNGQGGSGDIALGGTGQDLLRGGPGSDHLEGGSGDDLLIGGAGVDEIGTGLGEDVVLGSDGSKDAVDCRSGDRVRGDAKDLPEECGQLPKSARPPLRWPPRQAAVRMSSITPPDPSIEAWLRLRRDAHRYTIRAKASEDYALRVQICTYDAGKHLLRRFDKTVMTRHKRSYRKPGPRRRASYIRVRTQRSGCR
jgi:hemolysin type calcium-binding protein